MTEIFIVSAARTPVGKFLGGLSALPAPRLGAIAIKEAVRRAAVDVERIDEVLFGCVLQAGVGQAPARQAAIYAGLPPHISALTVNKVCGSGLKAVALAAQAIRAGDADIIVAGGMESMSNAPYLAPQARLGARLGHVKLVDDMIHDGLWDPYGDYHMGETCELVADKCGVTRDDMDRFAVASHQKAVAAAREGRFKAEIVGVEVAAGKEKKLLDADEGPRADASVEKLATLAPAFRKDGRVTAGNASTINDGAAALVVASERAVRDHNLKPLARITGYASGALEPKWVMLAPTVPVEKLRARGVKLEDMDLVEINEAFAGSTVALQRELKIDPAKLNVNGGAVALGHPIGASGARILVTLLHALAARNLKRGLATLCLGGGGAVALAVERP